MSKPRQNQRVLPYNYNEKKVVPRLAQAEFIFAKNLKAKRPEHLKANNLPQKSLIFKALAALILSFLLLQGAGAAESRLDNQNSQRDIFVRDLVIALIQNKSSHVSIEQHVETAFAAWKRYAQLTENEK